jgi:nicotinamide mononucleotide transporter
MIFERWFSWLFGIIAVAMYGISCYNYNIYGEMFLQFIYIIISVYGFYNWRKGETKSLLITKLIAYEWFMFLFLALIISGLSFFVLIQLQGALPILDAFTNGFAIIATYLAAKKKLGNWIIWIPVNILTVYMMLAKDMPFYAILYACYGIFAILGYLQWQKVFKAQDNLTKNED